MTKVTREEIMALFFPERYGAAPAPSPEPKPQIELTISDEMANALRAGANARLVVTDAEGITRMERVMVKEVAR